ncbi:MAG TPA: SusC/RagA family TonB-linked outer membrane protein, partial [Puia sp.]
MKILMLLVFAAFYLPLQAQQVTVTGKLLSGKDQTPLAGVSIRASGGKGAVSLEDGSFSLPASIGGTLHFSMEGFLPKDVRIGSASLGVVLLDGSQKSLDSVVVVGYGTQKKVNLTGAIATVNMEEKQGQPITNVSNALHGVPGLFVNLSNSQPGVDRSTIRIRGIGTLNSNDPLVLVDGIEYSMDELNPADIASISVLKDASAAIYGSRAANGVILVTTKKGSGTPKVNYSYYYGSQSTTFMPDAIWDPIAYMKLKNQAELNEGKTAVDYSDAQIAEYQNGMKTDHFTYPANNWFDIALDNGVMQKHDVSVAGSNDKSQYRLSLGYLDRSGVIIGSNDMEKKYSIGLNTSFTVSKRLKVGLNLDGYYRQYSQPFYNTFWSYLTRTLPILTDTLKDGRYGNSWLRTPGRNNWENPRMIANTGFSHKLVQRFLASTFLDYKLPFDITYHAQFGADKYDGRLDEFTPQVQTFDPKTFVATNWNSPATAPRAGETDYNNLSIHFYNTLNWQNTIASDHHVAVMLGSSYDNFGTGQFAASMTGYLDATLTALDAGTVRYATSGNSTTDVLESYFGRLNYDYDGRYLLEATFRDDGSSRFALGHRWGFFPSVSAGWRIDREKFFGSSDLFQLLKLRASIGSLGNQAVPLYSYENSI